MYELVQVGERTYYVNCPAKMGIYKINDTEVCLIDTGNDKEAGKKLHKILQEKGWRLKVIINTHSHADHIGGNALLQQRTGAPAYSVGVDTPFIKHPILEPSFLYGGYPMKELRNKFLMAAPSEIQELSEAELPEGMALISLDGHSFSMVGVKTPDNIWFLADALSSKAIIEKYHVVFLYDVEGYLNALSKIEALEGDLFIPSHAEATKDIKALVEINRRKVNEIIEKIQRICIRPCSFEEVLKEIFDHYQLTMDLNQYVLVGSTIRSYMAYMHDKNILISKVEDNRFLWQVK